MFDKSDVQAICAHMNDDHSDAVLLYVKAFAPQVAGRVSQATMVNLDEAGIDLVCRRDQRDTNHRILFRETGLADKLSSVAGARGMLVAMAKLARKKLAE